MMVRENEQRRMESVTWEVSTGLAGVRVQNRKRMHRWINCDCLIRVESQTYLYVLGGKRGLSRA